MYNEINNLKNIATSIDKKWLHRHTRDENEYHAFMRALNTISNYTPVDWVGSVGERRAIEHVELVENVRCVVEATA